LAPQLPPDLDQLRERLRRARWRARTATPGGPEWDAATAEIDELELALYGTEPPPVDPDDGTDTAE
jgi:hypothetical protein